MITIKTKIEAPIEQVWDAYNNPKHIINWNAASPDWHCPKSENDFHVGGKFKHTMAAKDGSFSFDFGGTYNEIIPLSVINYTLDDNRKVNIEFFGDKLTTEIVINFEAEAMNPVEMQQAGWQAILNNFKNYAEQIVKNEQ